MLFIYYIIFHTFIPLYVPVEENRTYSVEKHTWYDSTNKTNIACQSEKLYNYQPSILKLKASLKGFHIFYFFATSKSIFLTDGWIWALIFLLQCILRLGNRFYRFRFWIFSPRPHSILKFDSKNWFRVLDLRVWFE